MNLFSLPFLQYALISSILTGIALSLLGTFIVVKRISFSGLAASQMAALGTVIGVVLGLHYGEFGLAILSVGLGMFLLSKISKVSRTPQESLVACLYILGAGASVLLLSKSPHGESHTLNVFFGNVLSLSILEVWESLAIFLITGTTLWIWFNRWVWLSFDPVSCEVSGIKVEKWNFILMSLFTLTMTIAIHIFGVLLAFSYLLLPATIGLLAIQRLKSLFIFIPIFVLTITLLGYYFSFRFDFPTGPFIATILSGIALTTGMIRAWRGNS